MPLGGDESNQFKTEKKELGVKARAVSTLYRAKPAETSFAAAEKIEKMRIMGGKRLRYPLKRKALKKSRLSSIK